MESSVYRILNNEAKNWWWHRDLRKQGKSKEARQLERKSILRSIETLRDVLNHGGYLSLGGSQWSLNIFEHRSSIDSMSTCKYSLSGYYGLNKSCYLESICKSLGIPVLDSRDLSYDNQWVYIRGPLINKETRDGYVSLKDFVESKKSIPEFKFYNIK